MKNISNYILPLNIRGFWEIGGDHSEDMGEVTKARYYDILSEAGYKLQQIINGGWIDSDLIFNRSDRTYRVKPSNKG